MSTRKKMKRRASKRTKAQPGGEVFERTFKGKLCKVVLTPKGYRYGRKHYTSLTAVARQITGYSSVSGPAFFGRTQRKRKGGAN